MLSGASTAKGHPAAGADTEKSRDEHTRRGSGCCPMPSTVFPSPPCALSSISMQRQSGERSDNALRRAMLHRPTDRADYGTPVSRTREKTDSGRPTDGGENPLLPHL